jgi:putative ABC transport system permease protein
MRPELFLPVAQGTSPYVTFVVHADREPAVLSRELHQAVWSVESRLPIAHSSDLASIASNSVRRPRFFAWAMGLFAVAAVALSALAVHGVLTLDVVQRRAEIGIRMAIGALPGRIGASVLGRALVLGGSGAVIGLVLARGLSRYIESLLVEVTATDATVYVGAALCILLLALLAACAPAWHAIRVDPVRSLRADP